MNIEQDCPADVDSSRPKRPRRACAERLSYVKRDENNAYYQENVFHSGDRSDKEKGPETSKVIGEKGAKENTQPWEPRMQLSSNEALIILSLRVELTRSEETITKLKSELSVLSDKHNQLANSHENLKHEIARLKQTTLVSTGRTTKALTARTGFTKKQEKTAELDINEAKHLGESVVQVGA